MDGEVFRYFRKLVDFLLVPIRRLALSCSFLWPLLLEALLKAKGGTRHSKVMVEDAAVRPWKNSRRQARVVSSAGVALFVPIKQ